MEIFMKKLTACAILCSLLFNIGAAAEEKLYIGSGDMKYSGTAETENFGRNVTVTVINPGYEWNDEEWNAKNKNAILFFDTAEVSDNGEYNLEFMVKNSGIHKVLEYFDGADKNNEVFFEYVLNTDAEEILKMIKAAPDKENVKTIINENNNYRKIGLSSELLTSDTIDELSSIIYHSQNAIEPSKTEDGVYLCRKALAAAALNKSVMTDIDDYKTMSGIVGADFEKYYLSDKSSEITNRLSKRGFKNTADFDKAVLEAVLLTRVKYPDGYGDVKDIVRDYYKEIGLETGTLSSAAASKLAGCDYPSFEKFSAAVFATEKSDSDKGGGSGGSGGGGLAKGGGFSVADEEKEPTETKTYCRFSDMSGSEWAMEVVEELALKGIVNGRENGLFEPLENVTREEFAKMIVTAFNLNVVPESFGFDDVKSDAWYYEFVRRAYGCGVVKGVSENLFGSGQDIIRQDAFLMVYNALKYCRAELKTKAELRFNDADEISDYARECVEVLAANKVVSGDDNNMVNPKYAITRAEAAKLIHNIIGYAE